jgi:hypothetical protein
MVIGATVRGGRLTTEPPGGDHTLHIK